MGSKYTPSGALIRDPDHPGTQSIRSSVLFLDSLDTFSRISGLFQDHLENFQIIQTHNSRSSILFLEYPDTCFRLSGHFLHHMETFQFIPTLFRSPGNFPVHPDTLHIIWIFCIVSGHFPKYPEILQQIMSLLQKLSRFAKTFQSALLTR